MFHLLNQFAAVATLNNEFEQALVAAGVPGVLRTSLEHDGEACLVHALLLTANLAVNVGTDPLMSLGFVERLGNIIGSVADAHCVARVEALMALKNLLVSRTLPLEDKWKKIDACEPLVRQLMLIVAAGAVPYTTTVRAIEVLEIVMTLSQMAGALPVFVARMESFPQALSTLEARRHMDTQRVDHIVSAYRETQEQTKQARLDAEAAALAAHPPQGFPVDMFDPPLAEQLECGICSEVRGNTR
jgi:hypothetical protein